MFWIGKWFKSLSQSCSLRPALNFSCYIQSCQVHIHAIFTCVHALMHWHDSQTILQYHELVQKALHLQSLLFLFSAWCGDWRQFCTKTCISLHIFSKVSWISLHWYWKILSICISSWCSCWRLKSSGMWHSVAVHKVCYIWVKPCKKFDGKTVVQNFSN
jgi:hypothetical protein